MPTLAEWASASQELDLTLQRVFWKPLRNMVDIFHVLPFVAVVIIFILLATDGQIGELYISYLEGPRISFVNNVPTVTLEAWMLWIISMAAGLAFIALISAVLFEAHYALGTMRLNVVYSSYSNPDSKSMMRALQRAVGFILAFLPWLALAIGLFNARNFVADRYCQLLTLLKFKHITGADLYGMEHLWVPSGWSIAGALVVLGVATACFCVVGEQNRNAQRAIALCAPAVGVLLCALLTDWLNFSQPQWRRTAAICTVVVVLTAIYFWIYRKIYQKRGAVFFSGTGVSLRKRRRVWLALWAFLPWLCVGAYFVGVPHAAAPVQPGTPWLRCPLAVALWPEPGYWTAFPVAMCYTVAIGLLVGHLLGRYSRHYHGRRALVVAVVALAAFAVVVSCVNVNTAVAIYRFIGPFGTLTLQLLLLISTFALLAALSQRSGYPILLFVVVALIVALMFPSHLSATAGILGFVCLCVAAMALVSRRAGIAVMAVGLPVVLGVHAYEYSKVRPVHQNLPSVPETLKVKYRFACWLNQRGVPVGNTDVQKDPECVIGPQAAGDRKKWPAGIKYPVFIVAAEGGGIYAASAAAMFLARLQDLELQFDDHVFAISGVSGGSIGAAVFQALDHAKHQHAAAQSDRLAGGVPARDTETEYEQNPNCPPYAPAREQVAKEKLENKAINVMEDDHLSPVIGSMFTEIFGFPLNRPDALVASFENSTAAQDDKAGQDLCAPFAVHWKPASFAPALALNATWVEMGFRVAFAPFVFNDLDESLYSFDDPSMPDEKISLMQAASVSARFPLIMPPFSAVMDSADKATGPSDKRWNFVDGGYSDNSGATTALDIYKAVETVSPQFVDLRLILITSSIPQPDLAASNINGTVFLDTIAPLDALMKVREDLGNDAVARVCTYVYHDVLTGGTSNEAAPSVKKPPPAAKHQQANENCIRHAGGLRSPLNLVEIQDQTYGLSLGWKISKTSFDVVSRMLGKPGDCPGQNDQSTIVSEPDRNDVQATTDNLNAQLSNNILERNSCVLKTIVELVNGSQPIAVKKSAENAAR